MTSWEPLRGFLDRNLSKATGKEIIDLASPLLVEIVNYATNAFMRCQTSSSGKQNEDLAILSCYRHIIEMTDGIEVLLSSACPRPAELLVRSSFEALLSIEYLLENEKDYSVRSFCWLVGYAHQRIEMYERLDPSTSRGQVFAQAIASDPFTQRMSTPNFPGIDKAIRNLQDLLQKPEMQPIEAEYARLSTNRYPQWYHLFNGPANLRALACHLNHEAWYDLLYRYWSRTSHGNDFSNFLGKADTGEAFLKPLRDPATIHNVVAEIARHAVNFLLIATQKMLMKFRPGEKLSFARWYKSQVMARSRLL